MKWLYRHLYRKEKGFTLVELMMVIIILAILTGIAVPSYMVLRDRARTAAAKAELMNIATALGIYEADYGGYPVAGELVEELEGLGTGVSGNTTAYMDPVPITDDWGIGYAYFPGGTISGVTGLNSEYIIVSGGPDMVVDTLAHGTIADDDIGVINGQLHNKDFVEKK